MQRTKFINLLHLGVIDSVCLGSSLFGTEFSRCFPGISGEALSEGEPMPEGLSWNKDRTCRSLYHGFLQLAVKGGAFSQRPCSVGHGELCL